MTEALQLALRHAFKTLKLHRVEANVQPHNAASIALVKRAGFTLEGYSRRYLKVAERWLEHQQWAIVAEDWSVHWRVRRAGTVPRTRSLHFPIESRRRRQGASDEHIPQWICD